MPTIKLLCVSAVVNEQALKQAPATQSGSLASSSEQNMLFCFHRPSEEARAAIGSTLDMALTWLLLLVTPVSRLILLKSEPDLSQVHEACDQGCTLGFGEPVFNVHIFLAVQVHYLVRPLMPRESLFRDGG
jgi:hypothetical protein